MKKTTTILLLASFLAFQYARQVNYWECRLTNSFKTSNEKCDCEQLIKPIADQSETVPPPVPHNHFQMEETFYPACTVALKKPFIVQQSSRGMAPPVFIDTIIASRLERPPQML